MTDRFNICLPFTLAQECPNPNNWSNPKNFSNDAHDPGGETMCGIIQREYDLYRKGKGELTQPVIKISQDEGEEIYLDSYWMPHCPMLPTGGDMVFFDAAVNMGTNEAVKILQVATGAVNDGNWGPRTAALVAAISDVGAFIRAFTTRRRVVYRQMTGYQYFGVDWERRALTIETAALNMVPS